MGENADTQAQQPPSSPGPQHERLGVFVGKWKSDGPTYAEGQSNETLKASTVRMRSDDTFEWLPGGFFLVHHWDGMVGKQPFRGLEIIGYDESSRSYSSRFFDDQGNCPVYRITEHDGVWTYTGDRQCATFTFDSTGDSMTIHWDWSLDGVDWKPVCDLKAVKILKA